MTRQPADPPVPEEKTTRDEPTRDYDRFDRYGSGRDSSAGDVERAKNERKLIEAGIDRQNEHWVKAYWRPMMGWLYMMICFMDFIGFPFMSWMAPVIYKMFGMTLSYTAWVPLTLTNGGLIHLAFGAILGVTAWTRGMDKIQR